MLLQILPADGGMLYTETNLAHFIREPWNMVTSALFLIPSFYWIIKMRGFNSRYTFLSIAMWFLLIGCVGSTVYHGLRQWRFFIFMDWVPIALLCLMASVYFWYKLTGKWYYSALALTAFLGIEAAAFVLISINDVHIGFSANYAIMVLMILLPLALLLVKMGGHNSGLVLISLAAFSLALFFRVADKWHWLSVGTHFLWHTFGAIATSVIFIFIYRLSNYNELRHQKRRSKMKLERGEAVSSNKAAS